MRDTQAHDTQTDEAPTPQSQSAPNDTVDGGQVDLTDASSEHLSEANDEPQIESSDGPKGELTDENENGDGNGDGNEWGAEEGGQPAPEGDDRAPAKGDKKARVRQLEREGEVAADFLETLLDIADLDGDIDVDVDGDRAAVAIVDSDEGRVPRTLVGPDGRVLDALQELTRLAVQVETGERSRLMLDVAGYRSERRLALVELAKHAIAEVKESGAQSVLDPMSAFERKVVHDEVAAAGLASESEGVEPNRHIIILPA